MSWFSKKRSFVSAKCCYCGNIYNFSDNLNFQECPTCEKISVEFKVLPKEVAFLKDEIEKIKKTIKIQATLFIKKKNKTKRSFKNAKK